MSQPRPLTLQEKIYYLSISILLNTFGNALTISMNMGSSMWTAASVNISNYFPIQLGTVLLCNALLGIILNIMIDKKIDIPLIIGNFAFIFPFSVMVQFFVQGMGWLGLPGLPIWLRLVLNITGIFLIAIAISIYQRVNWIIHPLDELTNTIRFKFCNGNPVHAQLLTFSIPIAMLIIMFALSGHLYAVNLGTIAALLCQGSWIGWADKRVFASLPHYFRD
ncbi:hypothetical protein [Abiotrophia sp.]|uniref:hypothetical protein n=1 Tax=Abiotrophia sp. TaxID=76631 RepID=UPI001CAEC17F|nr:hypothetical protein [Abiotrophia sp.]MBF0937133.1 hypothetical protein [Abiotrophia sp.]